MYTIRKLPVHFSPHMFVRFPIFFIKFIIRCVHSVCAHVQWKKLHFENFILSPPVAYTGGEAVVLLPPMGFLGKGKNQVFWVKKELALIIKGVFSPLKSIVENFLGASPHLFSKFTVVFPFYLKSPPYCILDKQI